MTQDNPSNLEFTLQELLGMAQEAGMEVHERKGQVRIGSAVLTGCDTTEQVMHLASQAARLGRQKALNALAVKLSEPLTASQRRALAVSIEAQKLSVSLVQRKMGISYTAAEQLCRFLFASGLAHGLEIAPMLLNAFKVGDVKEGDQEVAQVTGQAQSDESIQHRMISREGIQEG